MRLLPIFLLACLACRSASRQEAQVKPVQESEATAQASQSCTPGSIAFSHPYLPLALARSPDGRQVVLLDVGGITVRDPGTLALRRHLAPRIDGWIGGSFAADGKTFSAATLGGDTVTWDAATWRVTAATPPHTLWRSQDLLQGMAAYQINPEELSLVSQRELALATEAHPSLRGLLEQVISKKSKADEEDELDLEDGDEDPTAGLKAVATDDARRRLVLAGRDTLTVLEADAAAPRSAPCAACAKLTALALVGDQIVGATKDRKLVLFDAKLAPTGEQALPSGDLGRYGRIAGDLFQKVTYGKVSIDALFEELEQPRSSAAIRQLVWGGDWLVAWIDDRGDMGVFDLRTGKPTTQVRPTSIQGVSGVALFPDVLAATTRMELKVWALLGGELSYTRPGAYEALARLDDQHALIARDDGVGEVFNLSKRAVERELCLFDEKCAPLPSLAEARDHLTKAITGRGDKQQLALAARRLRGSDVELLVSPDRRWLVAWTDGITSSTRDMAEGAISVFALPSLERRARRSFQNGSEPPYFRPDGKLYVRAGEAVEVSGLPVELNQEDPRFQPPPQAYAQGDLRVEVSRPWSPATPNDVVTLARADGTRLGALSSRELEEGSNGRFGQSRQGTIVDISPQADRVAIAGRVSWKWLDDKERMSGQLQVWCVGPQMRLPPDFAQPFSDN